MSDRVDAHALVAASRDLIRGDEEASGGLWQRASALLARQGLEVAMARLWDVTAPGLAWTSSRCQLLCLGTMLNDPELGGRVGTTWRALSTACHHRAYELPPTAVELNRALETVWELADAVEGLRGRLRAP